MAGSVSDFIVERMVSWGVRRVFGYPGDGINGVMGALDRAKNKVRFLQTRHEEMAAFMACAHAKFTGQVGVCIATSGPGAIHLLNGLYDAKLDHQPVVAIVGQTARTALGSDYQQEVDLHSLFKDVASAYVQTVASPVAVRHVIDRAFRVALAERTVTCVILPNDIQEEDAVARPPRAHNNVFSGIGYAFPRIVPKEVDLRRAADVLNAGRKVAILVGAGALHAPAEVMDAAERLQAGVAKALLGKAVLPDDLPYVTGAIGLLGTKPSYTMMQECDTLLMVGTNFPYAEFLPKEGQARCVQIDISPRSLSARYPAEVNLHGDSRLTLQHLLPLVAARPRSPWRERIEIHVEEWWRVMEARAHNEANPINPQRVFWECSPRLPDRAILAADSGTVASWFARDIRIRSGMMASLSGNLATMCPAVPYCIAAKFAYPERTPVAFVGDGAMQMLGINGLITVAKYWHEWSSPRFVVCVINNCDLNMVSWEQRVMAGEPKFKGSQDVPPMNFAAYAEQLGLEGLRIEKPEHVGNAWEHAFLADRPIVLDFVTDPDVPPLPPHVTFEQARSMLASMVKGDPDTPGMIRQSFRELVDAWFPGGDKGRTEGRTRRDPHASHDPHDPDDGGGHEPRRP
jgi:pyruvate dehydrogenase (quinone)